MVRFLPILVWLVLTVYALVDVAQSDQRRLGEAPKGLWVLGIVLLPFVGALTWLLIGKRRAAPPSGGTRWQDRPGPGGPAGPPGTRPPQRPPRPLGPAGAPGVLKGL